MLYKVAKSQKAQALGGIPAPVHEKVIRLFNTYTLVGGMPEIINNYTASENIVSLRRVYDTLLIGYKDDVEKYCDGESMRNVIRHILTVGWSSAAQRITFERFGNSLYRSREMAKAFRTLEKTMLLELAYPTTFCIVPLTGEPKRSPKLLWLDTGLVNFSAEIQKEFLGIEDIRDAWRGRIAEHIVGQELLTSENSFSHKRYFWVGSSTNSEAEVDYLVQYDNMIIPVEVESGHNSKLKSLHQFMEKSPGNVAVRFWSNPLSVDDITTPKGKQFRLINMPYYYAGCLEVIIAKLI